MGETTIYTIGHSTHAIDDFTDMLEAHGVKKLVDVRTIAKSRHNPQFNEDTLARSVRQKHITYRRMKELGGLRHRQKDSPNEAWRNASFRGYADYMQSESFREAIDKLVRLAHTNDLAIMCAEAVPWRCHRSLIGDALVVRDIKVLDIFSATSTRPHTITPFARVSGVRITYPPEPV